MIDLYYWPTPNGKKISIMLEELGVDYQVKWVDIAKGDQFESEFLAIAPNNRIPAIVDHDPEGGGAVVSLFESGAILLYLAQKYGVAIGPFLEKKAGQWTVMISAVISVIFLIIYFANK